MERRARRASLTPEDRAEEAASVAFFNSGLTLTHLCALSARPAPLGATFTSPSSPLLGRRRSADWTLQKFHIQPRVNLVWMLPPPWRYPFVVLSTWSLRYDHCTVTGDGSGAPAWEHFQVFVPERERLRGERVFWSVHCAGQRADLHHRGGHPGQRPRHPVRVPEQKTQERRWGTDITDERLRKKKEKRKLKFKYIWSYFSSRTDIKNMLMTSASGRLTGCPPFFIHELCNLTGSNLIVMLRTALWSQPPASLCMPPYPPRK